MRPRFHKAWPHSTRKRKRRIRATRILADINAGEGLRVRGWRQLKLPAGIADVRQGRVRRVGEAGTGEALPAAEGLRGGHGDGARHQCQSAADRGVTVRRLHDTARAGWWVLLGAVLLLGGIALHVMLALRGTAGVIEYGDTPGELAAA